MKNITDILNQYLPNRPSETCGNTVLVPTDTHTLEETVGALMRSLPLVFMFATNAEKKKSEFTLHYVFGVPGESVFIVPTLTLHNTKEFPSLAHTYPALALYEREIMTMFGLVAVGHPDPRSLILHEENCPTDVHPLRKDFAWNTQVPPTQSGTYHFNTVGGEGIYEIPVGPVHAGIIEPGHFRFSVAGEEIVSLEARLGWVHKGVEKLFETLPLPQCVQLSERISGDSSFSHSLAFCEALETLTNTTVPERAQYLRLVFAELERITMHIFDIGNIAGNGAGFSVMAAQGFRITEELRRLHESLCGSRFLRGINIPGGVAVDIDQESVAVLQQFLKNLKRDVTEVVDILKTSASFANRTKGTGVLPQQVAYDYHAVGIAARCCGIAKDVRIEYPYAAYKKIVPKIALEHSGDVDARFHLRITEVFESITLIEKALQSLPKGAVHKSLATLPDTGLAVAVVEGWRGEIAYAIAVEDGKISRVKVRDPAFIHWQLVSHLSSNDMVPDFPLINKSFNLSYSGNDL